MRIRRCLALALLLCLLAPHRALAAPLEAEPPFEAQAASLLLLEADSGQVIFELNADEERPVASVTKLMTILLLLEMLDEGTLTLEEEVTVSQNAASMGGSQALLDAGGVYKLETLLSSLIVASANDSAVALAEHALGSEENFVAAMNRRAGELGLQNTAYKNTTGLPVEGQHTTARDVAVLSLEMLRHERFFQYSTIWMEDLTHNSGRVTSLVNTNRLVRFYEGADGVKTGSTQEAGFCVSASAKRGELRFVAVVLGAASSKERFSIATSMLDYGFDHYAYKTLDPGTAPSLSGLAVDNAKGETVDLYLAKPLRYLCKKGEESTLRVEYQAPASLYAPFEKGQALGSAVVYRNDEVIDRVSLVAGRSVNPTGFLVNLRAIFRLWPVAGGSGSTALSD